MWSILVVYNKRASGANAKIPAACSGPDTVPPYFMQSSLPCPRSRGQIDPLNLEGKDLSDMADDGCQLSLSIEEATGI